MASTTLDRLREACDEDELNDPIDPIDTEYLLGESRIHLELDSLEQFGYETEEDDW